MFTILLMVALYSANLIGSESWGFQGNLGDSRPNKPTKKRWNSSMKGDLMVI